MAEIKIYIRPLCSFSHKLMKLLDKEKIDYDSVDLSKDVKSRGRIYHDEENHIPVPQVEINGRLIFDYSTEENLVEEIKELLKK